LQWRSIFTDKRIESRQLLALMTWYITGTDEYQRKLYEGVSAIMRFMEQRFLEKFFFLCAVICLLSACSTPFGGNATPTVTPSKPTPMPTSSTADSCPAPLKTIPTCYSPHALRTAYDIEKLTEQGYTGKGQTVIDIVSYGSPLLQQDMDMFDKQFGLPSITIQVLSPLGTVPFNPSNKDMNGWAGETELDVEIIHAIAPDAHIVVMTSPVDETEGTVGLPQFLQLEQYAVSHHLGHIFTQSYVASEATLSDSVGQALVKTYTNFYQHITTQDGFTVLTGSGDNGATDWENIASTQLDPRPTVNFPADIPWVTAVGGTTLFKTANGYNESAWAGSGGGVSKFFSEPTYQQGMSSTIQRELGGHRGIPDVAGDADPNTGMAFYLGGQWTLTGGTSASTPFWAALVAIADQMAGHPLGNINPGIYKLGTSVKAQRDFRDIISGSNAVNKGSIHVQGFQATSGWDAVTGWGTPQANLFIPDLIKALQ
jgi:subtilase family serine protease